MKVASTSQYENYRRFFFCYKMASIKSGPFAVSKDEWNTKEGTGKSLKNVLSTQQYGKRYLQYQAEATLNKKNQAYSLGHCYTSLKASGRQLVNQKKIQLNKCF